MTRREITENRIIQNILLHNDPKDMQNFNDLYISTRNDVGSLESALLGAGLMITSGNSRIQFNKSGFPMQQTNIST
jgi:hypothetical protein